MGTHKKEKGNMRMAGVDSTLEYKEVTPKMNLVL